jgi:hypothetical protein
MNSKAANSILTIILAATLNQAVVSAPPARSEKDTHYIDSGFFDIHVCNWPERKLFFMPLFSTARYDEIVKIDIIDPDGRPLVQMDLERFRVIKQKTGKEKHAFINQLDVPPAAKDGWYSAQITLSDGSVQTASDYVRISTLDKADGHRPGHDEEVASPPRELRWNPVPGAGFYQVFIRDKWNDDRLIHTSKLLAKPRLVLPPGLITPGGLYSWVVHARDINEDLLLGDFNHGSMSKVVEFSVSD